MLYFIITTSLFNDCLERKHQYLTAIYTIKKILNIKDFNTSKYKIIIIENNGLRKTFLDDLDCDTFYTENNFLELEKGYKEIRDILDCIKQFNIQDEDFIVKMTGRYILEINSNFINILKTMEQHDYENDYDCIIKYGNYYYPVNYKMDDCLTGLIGMRCKYLKQIDTSYEDDLQIERKWARITYKIEDQRIFNIQEKMGMYICPGGNCYFHV